MQWLLYGIWAFFPLLFFSVALWSRLEQIGNKQKRENPGDFFRQGIFLSGCFLACIAIDQFFLPSLVASLSPEWLPLGFFQVVLFPFVLFAGAKLMGPSNPILISKAPTSQRRKR